MEKLLGRGFKVRALTRSGDRAISILGSSPLLEVCEVDLKDSSDIEAKNTFSGCSGVLICTGTTAFPTSRFVPGRIRMYHQMSRLMLTRAWYCAGGMETMAPGKLTMSPQKT